MSRTMADTLLLLGGASANAFRLTRHDINKVYLSQAQPQIVGLGRK